jgi:hypothetical protein
MNVEINSGSLQRFADGELDDDQRNALLRAIDNEPVRWRELALAFVENQLIDQALGDNRDTAGPVRLGAISRAPVSRATGHSLSLQRRLLTKFTLAASLVCSAAAGYLFGATWSLDSAIVETAMEPGSQAMVDDVEMDFEEALARCSAPLFELSRDRLLAAGILVDPADRVMPVELPNGQRIEIPVRSYRVHYLGTSAYQ